MKPVTTAITSEPVTISPAGRGQASLLAVLIRQSYADVARRFDLSSQNAPTHPSACTADWIRSDRRAGVCYYLAAVGNRLIGCAASKAATPDCHYLMRLAVLPLFRGRGAGRRLVAHVCRMAHREGATELSIGIIAEQVELAAWYRRQGFLPVGRRRFDHLPFDVLFMRLDLGSWARGISTADNERRKPGSKS